MNKTLDDDAIRAELRRIILNGEVPVAWRPCLLDLRELEAPGPFEQAMMRASTLQAGESFVAHTPRIPGPLLARLGERGLRCVVQAAPDGSALVYIERP